MTGRGNNSILHNEAMRSQQEANFASETIWTGDNLPVLRGMNSACVDLIYLDPPFNSNRTYEAPIGSKAAGAAFKDAWTLDDVDVYEHGELADRNPAAYAVIEAARQAHGKGMQAYLIFMAVRLMEMKRILKVTGSIYIHCDDVAGPYLRLLMDGVFGVGQFRNEVIWRRYGAHNDAARRYGRVHDVLLYYTKDRNWTWNGAYLPHDPDYVARAYRHKDKRGRFRTAPLHTGGLQGGGYEYEFRGYSRTWRYSSERMQELEFENRIHQAKEGTGVPERKVYLEDSKGRPATDIWDDVKPLTGQNAERTGYPTQKPLALLERVIRVSSDPGDLVLDPFCGCATTLVAADRLQRRWAGIDLSPLAIRLVNERIAGDRGLWGGATALDAPPVRTDLGDLPNYRTHRHRLYGEQEGVCAGCDTHFPFRVMEVDHILPQSRGGTDHPDNLQLLCSGCNRGKGKRTMAEWRAIPQPNRKYRNQR